MSGSLWNGVKSGLSVEWCRATWSEWGAEGVWTAAWGRTGSSLYSTIFTCWDDQDTVLMEQINILHYKPSFQVLWSPTHQIIVIHSRVVFFFDLKTFHHSSKLPDWSVSSEIQNCSFRHDTTAALDPKCVCVCSAKRWNRILWVHCELVLFHINIRCELFDRQCSVDAVWWLTFASLRELFLCFCLVAQEAQLSFLLFLAP